MERRVGAAPGSEHRAVVGGGAVRLAGGFVRPAVSDVKTAGNRMTYALTCEGDGVRMVMQNELTVTGADAFTAVTKVIDAQGIATTMKLTARRVGDCPPAPEPTPPSPRQWSSC